ncbi:MAG: AAA family ATPase [Candidatus Bipolaricaulota bacterium]
MKLSSLAIHNFRGVHDAFVVLYDYNLLVGANDSGKSTVIDAVRAVYEKDGFKYKQERDFPFIAPADEEAWVELTFALTDAEDASLADTYRTAEKTLRLRKYLRSPEKDKEGYIFGYAADGTLSSESFYGAKNVQSGKIGDIVFIPAVSKVDEHTKLSGPSALRDLLTNVLEGAVQSSPAYEKLCADFETFAEKIKVETSRDGASLERLEAELTEALQDWGASFKVDLRSPSVAEMIKSLLDYRCLDKTHGTPLGAEQFGSGFQRHLIYTLIRLGAKYVPKKPSKKAKDFAPSMTLLLFEEPEAFLHPPQQFLLADSLRQLSAGGYQQVLCSTHSSHFVSRQAALIPTISCLRRESGHVMIRQISRDAWEKLADANQALNRIAVKWPKLKDALAKEDWMPEMEALKYFLWLNPDRCGMFFAGHVLIVEGPTEQALIGRLVDAGKVPRLPEGLYVLDGLGKYNIHRFMNLMACLGIPHSVLHDDDNGRDEHADLNQLIRDSKDAVLTSAIVCVPGELETFLAIPRAGSPHRKPQHVLYHYETGLIKEDRLRALRALVQSCMPVGAEAIVDETS